MSCICEEFRCLPSEAVEEPLELALRIMEDRAYHRAKLAVSKCKNLDDLPDDPMVALVLEIEFDIARAKRHG